MIKAAPTRILPLLVLTATLTGCASQAPQLAPAAPASQRQTGLDLMERLTLTANRCWVRSGDSAFSRYSIAPELSSFSGRPRFLLVPKGRPEDRPLLVVEGSAGSRDVSVYGPLLATPAGSRILADVNRWTEGAADCAA